MKTKSMNSRIAINNKLTANKIINQLIHNKESNKKNLIMMMRRCRVMRKVINQGK